MTHAPEHLWQATRDVVARLWRAFVSPAAIAVQRVLSRGEHVLLTRCVRGVEAMLRSLLFIEAAALIAADAVPAPKPRPRRSCAARQSSESDGIRFRVFASASRGRRRARCARPLSLAFEIDAHDAWPLAARAEAAMRVLDNPEPYIHRLAHKLKAAPRVAQRIPTVGVGHFRMLKDVWHDICHAVGEATRLLPDTS